MMRSLGIEAHLFERKADLPPYVFAPVERRDIRIARVVMRLHRRFSVFIVFEVIEFTFGADPAGKPELRGTGDLPL